MEDSNEIVPTASTIHTTTTTATTQASVPELAAVIADIDNQISSEEGNLQVEKVKFVDFYRSECSGLNELPDLLHLLLHFVVSFL